MSFLDNSWDINSDVVVDAAEIQTPCPNAPANNVNTLNMSNLPSTILWESPSDSSLTSEARSPSEARRAIPSKTAFKCPHSLRGHATPSLSLPFYLMLTVHQFCLDPSSEEFIMLDWFAVQQLRQCVFDLLVDLVESCFVWGFDVWGTVDGRIFWLWPCRSHWVWEGGLVIGKRLFGRWCWEVHFCWRRWVVWR